MPKKKTNPAVAPTTWEDKAKAILVGRKIVGVEWLSEDEAHRLGWRSRPIIITLDDGTHIYPLSDDEANDGGALGTTHQFAQTLPVF